MVDFEKYYKQIAKLTITNETESEMNGLCPFHSDKVTSFSANKKTGLWKCFGKCQEGGNVFQFHAKMHKAEGMTVHKAKKDIEIQLGNYKILPLDIIDKHHKLLRSNKQFVDFLVKERGLSPDIIKKFKLGCDSDRIYIPIIDIDGYLVNVRKYKPHAKDQKVISYKAGYGGQRIFPETNLTHKDIFIVEGEFDCILANQLGYNAITGTGGADSVKIFNGSLDQFKNKNIVICYDIDEAGQKGAQKLAALLIQVAKVKLLKLPITEPKNGDLTDCVVKYAYTKEKLDALISTTPYLAKIEPEKIQDSQIYDVQLDESANKDYYYKHIKMNVIASGKDLAPYFAPIKMKLTCKQSNTNCKYCPLNLENGRLDVEFSIYDNEILQLIDCTKENQKSVIRHKYNIKCNNFEVIPKEIINIEEIRVIPEIHYSEKDTEYVARQVYYLGYGIKTNRSYAVKGVTIPNPDTQYATQILYDVRPTQSSIDQFKLTPELYNKLKIFQTDDIDAKIKEINEDLIYNVTKIYGREDLITAVDLVYHSTLQFSFQGNLVQKGWLDGLIIGDTRCGKTESLIQLIQHYRLGELCTGENISYAGLVGGMSQTQQRWSINWGKIPLNDRRLIVLDEVSSLNVDTISNLSALRSSGIAEIIKIQTERTNARTRLIWVSNPRSGRKLDTYNYGILAVKELIGRVEDIARFDFAISVSSDDVPIEEINRPHNKQIPHIHTSELCNQLILWAWSRKADQIKFDQEATDTILQYAIKLGEKYSSSMPLVEGAEQRIKLARLSTSIAARTFSTLDGENLIVEKKHVDFVYNFLNKIYSHPALGYDVYSNIQKQSTQLTGNTKKYLEDTFKQFSSWKLLRDILLDYYAFRKSEIVDQTGYDNDESRRLFKWMTANKLIRSTAVGYVKQPIFTSFLKNMDMSGVEPDNDSFGV